MNAEIQALPKSGRVPVLTLTASVFAPAASVFCHPPLIFSHRDLCCYAHMRGTFDVERTWAHILQPPLWGLAGGCSPANAELQVSTGHVTNDTSGCLIGGISLVRLTWGFVAEDMCCCECTQAAITHRSVNRFCHIFLKWLCHWLQKFLGQSIPLGKSIGRIFGAGRWISWLLVGKGAKKSLCAIINFFILH